MLLNGIADIDIRREALSTEGILKKSVTNVIAFVETRETARNANHPSSTMSSLSTYRKSQNPAARATMSRAQQDKLRSVSPTAFDRTKTASCPDCDKTFHLFTKKTRGWNRRPHSRCAECWKKSRSLNQTVETSLITHSSNDFIGQISGVPHVQKKKALKIRPAEPLTTTSLQKENGEEPALPTTRQSLSNCP